MFNLTRKTKNLGPAETGDSEMRGSVASRYQSIGRARSRVYKDEALVSASLAGLPALLASLESFRE
ncbi:MULTISPECIES: hypothetical protein [unclassified Tychonema]|uniref:hypothetical protein n=1 Tax=unclassified Tychonema TaxID=2642144 RepID=UPI0018812394|nr:MULTISPECIES: hypothetical protein [unclassified Tychonema]MBE9096036.1 hypothetical protein [Tychonema sp. LEGE 07203]MBE9120409.1 hypothetical protein [Tychonema sp. LEGE 07199]MBE9131702.1 hypothetical protein [Tychonema sp. LEGE 07196]